MLQLLGQSEYGLYKLSSNITSYLSLISLGLGSAITRYLIKAREEDGKEAEEKMLGLFSRIFQVIAIVTFVVGVILSLILGLWYSASLTSSELMTMRVLVFILSLNTALNFLMTPQISVVTAHEKFIFLQFMNIGTTCIMPILNLVVLFFGFASIGMAVSSLILNVIIRIFYYIYMTKNLGLKAIYSKPSAGVLKEILSFSFWIFVANVVGQLYNSTDVVMIGAIPALATVGVAVYNVGGVFNGIVFSLTTAVSNLLAPKTQKMVFSGATNDELTDLAIRMGRIQCYIITLLITGFISFGQPFISFYVGGVFNGIVFSLTTAVSNLLAPKTQKMVFSGATNDELTDLAIRMGRIQCYIITLLITGFISFGQPFISFYVGSGYEDAYWVAVLMMIPNMIPLVQSVCLSVIIAQNKHRFRSIVYLGIAIGNVIGTWFLMHIMGIIGAALMTGIALIIGQGFVMNWYYRKKTGLDMIRFWKSVGKIYVLPTIMCCITIVISHFINFYNIFALLVGIIIYTVLYVVLNWLFIMNDYEKNIFIQPLTKIFTKLKRSK